MLATDAHKASVFVYSANMKTHGMNETPTWWAWHNMRKRCKDGRKDYGGRGIKVCARWLKFENFFADIGERPSQRHSLDRIDANGDYEPNNCRWTTQKVQMRNTRRAVTLTYRGVTKSLADWGEQLGIDYHLLYERKQRLKWSDERVLTEPVNVKNRPFKTVVK